MGTSMCGYWLFISFALLVPILFAEKQSYIIQMNHYSKPNSFLTHLEWYQSLTSTSDSIYYTYTTAFHGFAANLEPEEVESLKKLEGEVVNVFEDKVHYLRTTRTPEFLGVNSNFNLTEGGEFDQVAQAAAEDIIVGVVDTGVWPESKSFDDTGLPPIPKRWRGSCASTKDFDGMKLCNKKIIGCRYFKQGIKKKGLKDGDDDDDILSGRDYDGHGTHTASTIAGSRVENVSAFGYARGTARGMATRARLAIYKVCWSSGRCVQSDILAGMEQALKDGVDMISLSLGLGPEPIPYHNDPVAIGAFMSMQKGVLVSCAAGNSGPNRGTIENGAPWILTVAAGSIDRDFPGYALLGNKQRLKGVTIYSGPGGILGNKPVGLVYANTYLSNYCEYPSILDPTMVRGKVVVCHAGEIGEIEKTELVRKAGGVGMILVDERVVKKVLASEVVSFPTVVVGKKSGDLLKHYIEKDPNPTVQLSFGETVVGVQPSPVVASFSSRGPSHLTPQILKPDILAPGVNILAAWTGAADHHKRTAGHDYNIISGTSMSCPHATGVAALVKAAHPNWSPSAIKSAIMTSAYTKDNTGSLITDEETSTSSNPWAYGSGHINPRKALSPGLIYDISSQDYVTFICSLGYPLKDVQALANKPNLTCSKKFELPGQLNYPSFSVTFDNKTKIRYTRELTNVGVAGSTYKATVAAPPSVVVKVKPSHLVFKKIGDKHKYEITFTLSRKDNNPAAQTTTAFGSLVWYSNNTYLVKSPISFTWPG